MSPKPLYRQVADALRAEIADGTRPPGSKLPSERALCERFDAARNTVRMGLNVLITEGLVIPSHGRGYEVRSAEVFVLNASRSENLTLPQEGDSYTTDVKRVGREPHQEFRVELVPLPPEAASRLRVESEQDGVLRFCLRYLDGVPWSTQATYYPMWLAEGTRIAQAGDIAEGTTRYLADRGIEQVGYYDELLTRMPTPEEARDLQIGPGVPVLVWTRTGYGSDRPIRCTVTTFRGDLNRITFEVGDLSARGGQP
ncbi:GntR family transcriptional regulator [Streptomyces sp. NBRC 109706]|uniref:GntR family transcriptional regulator n=1 Tax=Streptomyces sp. NBRC 109706 TaxID=1550035 RepID=UPI0007811BF6|nr:GntR family transcriptional regulator [Streptomyces sp. NBRC 109706]